MHSKPVAGSQFLGGHCRKNVKNLEVVGAFSAKKNFSEKIIFDDLHPTPPVAKKFSVSVPF
jgi:hypothetical protein